MPEPDDTTNDITERLANLAYTGVGLGVLAVNRAQVALRKAERDLAEGANTAAATSATDDKDSGGAATDAASTLQALVTDPGTAIVLLTWLRNELQGLDNRLGGIENQIGDALDRLEPQLPEAVRPVVAGLRDAASDHAVQFRAVLGLDN